MSDKSSIPTFGEPEDGVSYLNRPCAYGFLFNKHDELAVIETSFSCSLPGGGIEGDETEELALKMELNEEMGVRLQSAELVCRANQYLYSRYYQKHFLKVGSFYRVESATPILVKMQADHELLWMDPRQAKLDLSSEFQRWALTQLTR